MIIYCILQLEKVTISFDGGLTTMNFAEAAMVIQGSVCVYSKKVKVFKTRINVVWFKINGGLHIVLQVLFYITFTITSNQHNFNMSVLN